MQQEEISGFYDEFSEKQEETGANERLISLYKRIKKWGLHSESKVLELGCGVGAFTKLLAKTVKKGAVEAVDLSPKSIQIAQKTVKNHKINFKTDDVVHYTTTLQNLDFITLMDVIEHIPVELHAELFLNIAKQSSEKTLILINIPNPYYLEYQIREKHPELQIIDQPVWFASMVKNLDEADLEIIFFEKYSIWHREDYDFFLIRKKRAFELQNVHSERNIIQKGLHKINSVKNEIAYR